MTLESQNTGRAGKFASVNEKKHLDSTVCTHLEPISTFGASKHLDITTGSLDKVQDDAGRCRSIPITVVSADIRLVCSGHSLSIAFDASREVYRQDRLAKRSSNSVSAGNTHRS